MSKLDERLDRILDNDGTGFDFVDIRWLVETVRAVRDGIAVFTDCRRDDCHSAHRAALRTVLADVERSCE